MSCDDLWYGLKVILCRISCRFWIWPPFWPHWPHLSSSNISTSSNFNSKFGSIKNPLVFQAFCTKILLVFLPFTQVKMYVIYVINFNIFSRHINVKFFWKIEANWQSIAILIFLRENFDLPVRHCKQICCVTQLIKENMAKRTISRNFFKIRRLKQFIWNFC